MVRSKKNKSVGLQFGVECSGGPQGADSATVELNPCEYSAFEKASRDGLTEVVALLLKNGAEITPLALQAAASQNHPEIVDILLKKGTRTIEFHTAANDALKMASGAGHTRVVETLLANEVLASAGPLVEAAKKGHDQIVRILLRHRADHGYPKKYGLYDLNTALDCACRGGFTELTETMLAHGAMPSTDDLFSAVRGDHINTVNAIIPVLLEKRIQLDKSDQNGFSALEYACVEGSLKMVKTLLDKGFPASQEALIAAEAIGNNQIIKILLDNGAQPKTPDKRGYMPGEGNNQWSKKAFRECVRIGDCPPSPFFAASPTTESMPPSEMSIHNRPVQNIIINGQTPTKNNEGVNLLTKPVPPLYTESVFN